VFYISPPDYVLEELVEFVRAQLTGASRIVSADSRT
jgi:hypothetical protein